MKARENWNICLSIIIKSIPISDDPSAVTDVTWTGYYKKRDYSGTSGTLRVIKTLDRQRVLYLCLSLSKIQIMRAKIHVTACFFLLTSCFLIIGKNVHSQSYQIQYQVEFANLGKIENLPSDTVKAENKINDLIPITFSLIYDITYFDGYMEVTGYIKKNSSRFEVEEKSTHIFFDLNRNLAYFPEENVVKKMILYDLIPMDSNNKKCNDYFIKGFNTNYNVLINDTLPRFVSPAVKFIQNKSGVAKIVTPTFKIDLIKFKKMNERPDFQTLIQKLSELEITGEYRFLK